MLAWLDFVGGRPGEAVVLLPEYRSHDPLTIKKLDVARVEISPVVGVMQIVGDDRCTARHYCPGSLRGWFANCETLCILRVYTERFRIIHNFLLFTIAAVSTEVIGLVFPNNFGPGSKVSVSVAIFCDRPQITDTEAANIRHMLRARESDYPPDHYPI